MAIASGNELVRPGSSVILAGFGTTRNRHVNDTGTLRYTNQTVSRVNSSLKLVTTGSGVEASGACAGDSGGPVYIQSRDAQGNLKLFLQGVLSTGAEARNGACLGTNNYTDPAAYKEWIEATKAVLLAAEQRGISSVRP